MIEKDEALKILQMAIDISSADQTEAVLIGDTSALTRSSNSYIHQNVAESDAELLIRTVIGKKIGSASTNTLSEKAIRGAVQKAMDITKLQPDNPDFVSLPSAEAPPKVDNFVVATAECTPQQRAKVIADIIRKTDEAGLRAAGAFSTSAVVIGVANSLGVQSYDAITNTSLNIVAMSDNSSGYVDFYSKDVNDIDAEKLASISIDKALRSKDPKEISPGKYTVILEADVVVDMVEFLAYLGLSALAVQESRSFMCGKFGEKIVGENITIWDDALDERVSGVPFDFEGVPKQKVVFIERGVAKEVVYDSYTAGREDGKRSTGHALPAPNIYGPMPTNMIMQPGDSTLEEMIKSTERGILVTRFHYTNAVDPMEAVITGMTRDGTFLIEEGEIKTGIKNLRFTQSILEAFSNVEMITKATKLFGGFFGCYCVPAIKVSEFNFTGVTQF